MTNLNIPLWTAIVTPFTENLDLDTDSLEYLLKQQEDANIGALLLGSTGEALNMRLAQKIQMLDFVFSKKWKMPFMAGVSGHQLEETLSWVALLNKYPLDYYLVPTPLYAKPMKLGQEAWFKAILDTANKPCVLYNIPGRAAASLNFEALKNLVNHPRFYGMKEASGDVNQFKKYQSIVGEKGFMYSGDDALFYDFHKEGAIGIISVASNVLPKETKTFVTKVLRGKASEKEIKTFNDFSNSLFLASNPIPAKVSLHKLGQIKSPILLPPLDHREEFNLDALLTNIKNMQSLFN